MYRQQPVDLRLALADAASFDRHHACPAGDTDCHAYEVPVGRCLVGIQNRCHVADQCLPRLDHCGDNRECDLRAGRIRMEPVRVIRSVLDCRGHDCRDNHQSPGDHYPRRHLVRAGGRVGLVRYQESNRYPWLSILRLQVFSRSESR